MARVKYSKKQAEASFQDLAKQLGGRKLRGDWDGLAFVAFPAFPGRAHQDALGTLRHAVICG